MVADSHSILVKWRNYFSQLLNVHGVNGVKQTEMHTAEPLVELAIEKLKTHKSPGNDKIPAGVRQFTMRFINLLFPFGIRRNCLRSGRSRLKNLSTRRAIKQT